MRGNGDDKEKIINDKDDHDLYYNDFFICDDSHYRQEGQYRGYRARGVEKKLKIVASVFHGGRRTCPPSLS